MSEGLDKQPSPPRRLCIPRKCGQYPNGLVYHGDRLLVATYFGILEVYSSELKLIHKEKLDVQGHPSQICMAGGSLVVASRDRGGVVIFEPVDGFPFGRGSRDRGDRVFVSEYGYLSTFRLSDGELLDRRKGGVHWQVSNPYGLCIIEEKLLAVADRGADRVLLLSLDEMELLRELPMEGSASGVTKLGMPNDVVADAAGNLLVMDTRNERVAVFRQDGTFIASIMEGFFKDKGNTFSYLACNVETGVVALSNNDMHELALLSTDPARLVVAE